MEKDGGTAARTGREACSLISGSVERECEAPPPSCLAQVISFHTRVNVASLLPRRLHHVACARSAWRVFSPLSGRGTPDEPHGSARRSRATDAVSSGPGRRLAVGGDSAPEAGRCQLTWAGQLAGTRLPSNQRQVLAMRV